MTTTLVIGAGGQIGSDLVPAFARQGHDVRMFDLRPPEETSGGARLAASMADDPGWRERWHVGDAAGDDLETVLDAVRPGLVVHLAALLSATGEAEPDRCWDVNMGSLRRVLDVMERRDDRPCVLWPSSIAVFGPLPADVRSPAIVPNEYPLLPTTMYGVTKVAGELLGAHAATRGVDFRGLRLPGILSATEPGGGSSDYANEMYFAAARGDSEVSVFVRDDARMPFMHIDDTIEAFVKLAEAPEHVLTRRTYNVTGFSPSAGEIAAAIAAAGRPLAVRWEPDHRQAFVDSWPDALDDSAARSDWGWAPRLDLAATTARLLQEIGALVEARD